MNKKRVWSLMTIPTLAGMSLLILFLSLGQLTTRAATNGHHLTRARSPVCDTLTDVMERDLCHFATGIYSAGLLTDWRNPRLTNHFDHPPMRDYTEPISQSAISESASMLALYAALIDDQTTFDYVFDVSAPAEIGGTGALMSSTQETLYYFASPNLCLPHWILDENGYKEDSGTGWLASAGGEANRWLEALAIAEQKFPDPKYRLFANCLAWGMMGATDFDPGAVGHFENPGTPEAFDDYLMRPYFGWRADFSDFDLGDFSNVSYNNLLGWLYAAQLGQAAYPLYQTTEGVSGTVVVTIPMQAVSAIRIDMTERYTSSWGYSLYEVEAHSPFTDANLFLNADCTSSSYQDDVNCPACTCKKALDGDRTSSNSRWSSEQPINPGGPLAPQWLVITPTQSSRVMTITLYWERAHASSYSLTASWPFADFYSQVLSYTAPVMVGSMQQGGAKLPRVMYDVEHHFYYGEILAPNLTCTTPVTATASSIQDNNPDYFPIKATDCFTDTRWSSNWADDEWIALEFSGPITIDGAVLKWQRAYGKAYTIDVSDDGVTWRPVYTETNGRGTDTEIITHEIHFPLTTTRRIRMHGLERGTQWGYSLWEFEVYRGGTSSLTALDLARRGAAYAEVSGDPALWEMGQRILNWYRANYTSSIAAAYDPYTGDPLPGWEHGEWTSIMADLVELAAEYGDYSFARRVIEEKLCPKWIADPDLPFQGSAFDILEVLLALRHVHGHCPSLEVTKHINPSPGQAGAPLTYTIYVTNTGNVTFTAIITDVLPAHVMPTGVLTWPVVIIEPKGVWSQPVIVTPTENYSGTLTNRVEVATEEGAIGSASVTVCVGSCVYLPVILK